MVLNLIDALERAFRLGWERRDELLRPGEPPMHQKLRDDLATVNAQEILREIRLDRL
jgi:hypothetical protein